MQGNGPWNVPKRDAGVSFLRRTGLSYARKWPLERAKTRSRRVVSEEDLPPFARKWLLQRAQTRFRSVIPEEDLPSLCKEIAPGTCQNEVQECHFCRGLALLLQGNGSWNVPKRGPEVSFLRRIGPPLCKEMARGTCQNEIQKCHF